MSGRICPGGKVLGECPDPGHQHVFWSVWSPQNGPRRCCSRTASTADHLVLDVGLLSSFWRSTMTPDQKTNWTDDDTGYPCEPVSFYSRTGTCVYTAAKIHRASAYSPFRRLLHFVLPSTMCGDFCRFRKTREGGTVAYDVETLWCLPLVSVD